MNTNPAWQKLVTAARTVQDDRPVTAPYGFSTRVAALALAGEVRPAGSLVERWSWRALALAGMFAAATVAANYSSYTSLGDASPADDLASEDATIEEIFD
jgi:hypothetical protein